MVARNHSEAIGLLQTIREDARQALELVGTAHLSEIPGAKCVIHALLIDILEQRSNPLVASRKTTPPVTDVVARPTANTFTLQTGAKIRERAERVVNVGKMRESHQYSHDTMRRASGSSPPFSCV